MSAITLSPDSAAQRMRRFRAIFDANDLAAAEDLARTCRAGPPEMMVELLTHLGVLRRRSGQRDAAFAAFVQAAGIARAADVPLPDWHFSELSGLHIERQEWARACAVAQDGIAAKPVLGLTAATALARLGRLAEARTQLRDTLQALAGAPARAAVTASACLDLLAADPGNDATELVATAAGLYPSSPHFDDISLTLAIRRQDWRMVGERCAGALAGPPAARTALLRRLAPVLAHATPPAGLFDALYAAAIRDAPLDEGVMFQWRDQLGATLSADAVTERLCALQADADSVIPSVFLEIVRRRGLARACADFPAQIVAWRHSETARACDAYMTALCTFAVPPAWVGAAVRAAPVLLLRLFFLLRQPAMQCLQIRAMSEAECAILRRDGIAVDAVLAFLTRLVGAIPEPWNGYLETATYASPEARDIVARDESFVSFQDRIVRDRDFHMIDPLAGTTADFVDSVKIHDRQIFAFRGRELVLVHTAGNMNFLIGIHLPRRNLLLTVDTPGVPSKQGFYAGERYMCEVLAIYLHRAAAHHAAFLASAKRAPGLRGQPKRITVIHGRAENPAHHVWNYLPPFDRLAHAATLSHVTRIIAPPTAYFGGLPDLFPEISAGIEQLPEKPAIDPSPFDPGEIALQLGASFVTRGLLSRIRRWAERETPAEMRQHIAGLASRRRLVWIGLRVDDKVWIDQTDGVAEAIDMIAAQHPGTHFLLDGFSRPPVVAEIPEKWRAAVGRLHTIAEAIRDKSVHRDAIENLVGNTLSESVLWAAQTDVYFCPAGSSQHKVGWFSAAPGVVYATPGFARNPPARRQGAWESELGTVPSYLIGDVASPGKRRSTHDFRTNLENVRLDAAVVAQRIIDLLRQDPVRPEALLDPPKAELWKHHSLRAPSPRA